MSVGEHGGSCRNLGLPVTRCHLAKFGCVNVIPCWSMLGSQKFGDASYSCRCPIYSIVPHCPCCQKFGGSCPSQLYAAGAYEGRMRGIFCFRRLLITLKSSHVIAFARMRRAVWQQQLSLFFTFITVSAPPYYMLWSPQQPTTDWLPPTVTITDVSPTSWTRLPSRVVLEAEASGGSKAGGLPCPTPFLFPSPPPFHSH